MRALAAVIALLPALKLAQKLPAKAFTTGAPRASGAPAPATKKAVTKSKAPAKK